MLTLSSSVKTPRAATVCHRMPDRRAAPGACRRREREELDAEAVPVVAHR